MKKLFKWSCLVFVIYGIFITWYLLYGAGAGIPDMYKGTSADPAQFMNDRQLTLSYDYSRIKNVIFFLVTPLNWLILFAVLVFGISERFRNWAKQTSRGHFLLETAIYVFWYSLLTAAIILPIQWISYKISKSYGIATSTFQIWMKDQLIDFWLGYLMMVLTTYVIYLLIRKAKRRWWFYTWLLSIPFMIFFMFVKPVIIDPLYNDFYTLTDKHLEEKILTMANEADIPADHVYEVNMSAKTNALNAYVTGIGSNSRIVLWDTTLKQLTDNEVMFIMAHEMAHYVKKHIYVGIAGYLLLSLLGFYLTDKLIFWMNRRWGNELRIKGVEDLASLPLILLIFSLLSFSVSPFENAFSRYQEHAADKYAIEMTGNKEAAVTTFQQLTISGLSEVNPPTIVKLFRYGHPTMIERISFIQNFKD